MDPNIWQLRRLENDWWNWRMLCWVRDAALFMWVVGAVLMVLDNDEGKTFGFWLLWFGLAAWPIIMVLGWRVQQKARDVERQYRPYIRGWFSLQALGWVVLGLAIVLYARSFVTPMIFTLSHRNAENSLELAEGRLIVVTYSAATVTGVAAIPSDSHGGQGYLAWSSLSSLVNAGGSSLRGQTTMRHADGRLLKCQYAVIPLVAALPLALIWPLAWGGRIRAVEKRRKANQCPNCGYDLRESPQQCPECGREVMRLIDQRSLEGQVI